jgi:hypothetical protein
MMDTLTDIYSVTPPGGFPSNWSTRDCLYAVQLFWKARDFGYNAANSWSLATMTTEKFVRSSHIQYAPFWEARIKVFTKEAGVA